MQHTIFEKKVGTIKLVVILHLMLVT